MLSGRFPTRLFPVGSLDSQLGFPSKSKQDTQPSSFKKTPNQVSIG